MGTNSPKIVQRDEVQEEVKSKLVQSAGLYAAPVDCECRSSGQVCENKPYVWLTPQVCVVKLNFQSRSNRGGKVILIVPEFLFILVLVSTHFFR